MNDWLADLWHFPFLADVWGTSAEWFSGIASFFAVCVALWQSFVIRKQADEDAAKAAAQFQEEVSAANQRTVDEVQAAERRSQLELVEANRRHEVELEQQRQLARVQRLHIREQDFKNALIRVTKAAGAYTYELATLLELGRRVVIMPTSERGDALHNVSKQLGRCVQDFSIELAGAHMFTQDDEIHDALNRVNAAMLLGPAAENTFRDAVMTGNQVNDATGAAGPIFRMMEAVQTRLGEARQLAGDKLNTGWV